MEGPAWPTRASVRSERRTRSDPSDEPSEPNLGRPKNSRRTAQTRYEHRRDQREQVHGSSPEAAIADLADLLGESREESGIGGLLHCSDSPLPSPLRILGTIRRECLDHVIVFNEASLYRHVKSFVTYYHESRTHLSLGKDSPESRPVQPPELGRIVAIPQVGGLHHRYERRAA